MAGPSTFVDKLTSKIGSAIGLNTELPTRKTVGFDINEFKSQIAAQNGVLPTNLFMVNIYPSLRGNALMNKVSNTTGIDAKTLSFFCSSVTIPGVSIATSPVLMQQPGPMIEFPTRALPTTEMQLSFIGDGNGNILNFFAMWLNAIAGFNIRDRSNFYRTSYRDDTLCEIDILIFNQSSDTVLKYTLHEAFPKQLSDIGMSWAGKDTAMEIPVTMTYRTWSTDKFDIPDADGKAGNLTFMQKILKTATAAQTLYTVRNPRSVGDIINVVNNAHVVGTGLSSFF